VKAKATVFSLIMPVAGTAVPPATKLRRPHQLAARGIREFTTNTLNPDELQSKAAKLADSLSRRWRTKRKGCSQALQPPWAPEQTIFFRRSKQTIVAGVSKSGNS
jgi:hypothetical protein